MYFRTYSRTIWLEGWKSENEMIENGEEIEKWEYRRD